MTNIPHTYREMTISSALMEVPREAYQRNFNVNRAKKIAEEFDERIANEPKVSFRDGRYFVFDGQHTVACSHPHAIFPQFHHAALPFDHH